MNKIYLGRSSRSKALKANKKFFTTLLLSFALLPLVSISISAGFYQTASKLSMFVPLPDEGGRGGGYDPDTSSSLDSSTIDTLQYSQDSLDELNDLITNKDYSTAWDRLTDFLFRLQKIREDLNYFFHRLDFVKDFQLNNLLFKKWQQRMEIWLVHRHEAQKILRTLERLTGRIGFTG